MRRSLLVLVVVLNLAAVARGEPPIAERLDGAVRRATLGQFWGAVLVAKDGEVLLAKGYADADESGRPITDRSLFDIGSITKCFTAAAVLKLAEQGKLSLDDPVTKFYPDAPERAGRITLRHLLNHTAGLAQEARGALDAGDDREAIVGAYLQAPFRARPGDRHEYSNPGYFILAAVIEKAAGEPWEAYLTREILLPAGMRESGCCADPRLDPALLTARMDESWMVNGTAATWPYPYTWGYRGAGGVVASARDLYHWDRALRTDAVLSVASREQMFTPALDDYALGWRVEASSLGRVASHTGAVRGYVSALTRWLDRDACIVVLTNQLHDPVRLTEALRDVAFPEAAERVSLLARTDALKKEGEWMGVLDDCHLEVTRRDGRTVVLVSRAPDAPPVVEFVLSPGATSSLAVKLEAAIEAVGRRGAKDDAEGTRIEVYTASYNLPAGAPLQRDGDGVVIDARAGSMHPEPGGSTRVLVYIRDERFSMLPVFLKLERASAARLLDDLRRAPTHEEYDRP